MNQPLFRQEPYNGSFRRQESLLTTIGLTGGIASGKSTVARIASERGAHVIDADKLGHAAYEPGTRAFTLVVQEFGDEILASDGNIDRKVLGAKVFGADGGLDRLTGIVWPEIRRMAEDDIAIQKKTDPDRIVVLEAAVLLEAGWEDVVDKIWVVVVDSEVAIERAMKRDGIGREAVEARLAAQLSNEERQDKADVVIDNSGSEEDLLAQIEKVWSSV